MTKRDKNRKHLHLVTHIFRVCLHRRGRNTTHSRVLKASSPKWNSFDFRSLALAPIKRQISLFTHGGVNLVRKKKVSKPISQLVAINRLSGCADKPYRTKRRLIDGINYVDSRGGKGGKEPKIQRRAKEFFPFFGLEQLRKSFVMEFFSSLAFFCSFSLNFWDCFSFIDFFSVFPTFFSNFLKFTVRDLHATALRASYLISFSLHRHCYVRQAFADVISSETAINNSSKPFNLHSDFIPTQTKRIALWTCKITFIDWPKLFNVALTQ